MIFISWDFQTPISVYEYPMVYTGCPKARCFPLLPVASKAHGTAELRMAHAAPGNFRNFSRRHVDFIAIWLVVLTILKHMSSSMGRMTSHIWNGKKKCLKPPISNNLGGELKLQMTMDQLGSYRWSTILLEPEKSSSIPLVSFSCLQKGQGPSHRLSLISVRPLQPWDQVCLFLDQDVLHVAESRWQLYFCPSSMMTWWSWEASRQCGSNSSPASIAWELHRAGFFYWLCAWHSKPHNNLQCLVIICLVYIYIYIIYTYIYICIYIYIVYDVCGYIYI